MKDGEVVHLSFALSVGVSVGAAHAIEKVMPKMRARTT